MSKQELRNVVKHMDLRDVWENIDDILSSGFTMEEVLDLGEPYDMFFAENYLKILEYKPDFVVERLSIDDIKEYCCGKGTPGYHGLGVFVKEFTKAGGNAKLLAEKFLAEKGYPEDEDDLMALTVMLNKGAKQVDANKIVDSLLVVLSYKHKEIDKIKFWFEEMLQDFLDPEHLEKLAN